MGCRDRFAHRAPRRIRGKGSRCAPAGAAEQWLSRLCRHQRMLRDRVPVRGPVRLDRLWAGVRRRRGAPVPLRGAKALPRFGGAPARPRPWRLRSGPRAPVSRLPVGGAPCAARSCARPGSAAFPRGRKLTCASSWLASPPAWRPSYGPAGVRWNERARRSRRFARCAGFRLPGCWSSARCSPAPVTYWRRSRRTGASPAWSWSRWSVSGPFSPPPSVHADCPCCAAAA
jgi:hypothetical protein